MSTERRPIVLPSGGGRRYDMPGIRATFKADGTETADAYSISTWRLEPHRTGPGAHSHREDDVFFVTEGVMSLLVDGEWIDAPVGTFVLVPGGATHDFENRGDVPATVLNFSAPGAFEAHMPGIAGWFREHPPSYA
ncbi:MAG: cupin domain-containing protein [Pseudonocardia sp.]|jgi:mannose-6-phosphate isomerase-like protein (cupin superfamily)